jgi:hypothetical protein
VNVDPASFDGWTPIRLYWRDNQPMVDWMHVGDARLTEAFFEQTIGNAAQRPFNLLFRHQTRIEMVAELNARQPGLPLAGFIFHMSRCGSTLISQMLAALPQNKVLSEPRILEFIFREHPGAGTVTDEQRIGWLRAIVGALGWRSHPEEQRYFIKFDSWQTLHLPLIRRAFPEVPWVFVYRQPEAVLASHQREPAAQMLPGVLDPRRLAIQPADFGRLSFEEYCARVLAAICEAALAQAREGCGLFLNYSQLPGAVFSSVGPHFGLSFNAEVLEVMRRVSLMDAKNPSIRFDPARREQQAEPRQPGTQLARQLLIPLYEKLEKICPSQSTSLNFR